MVRRSLNVGLVMNLVIMNLNVPKERKFIRESSDLEIVCMQMNMTNLMKEFRLEVMMS